MHVCYFSMHKLFYDTGGQHSICATISYLYRRNGVRGQLSYRTSYAKHTLHMHHRNRKISSVKCMVARYQLLFTGVCSKAPRCPSSISSCCLYLEIQIFPFSRQSLGSLQSVMKFQHPSIRAVPPPLSSLFLLSHSWWAVTCRAVSLLSRSWWAVTCVWYFEL